MSSLKNSLIRLGYKNPELRSDLRPILDHLTQRKTAEDPFYDDSYDDVWIIEQAGERLWEFLDDIFVDPSPLNRMTIDEIYDDKVYAWVEMSEEDAIAWLNAEANNPRGEFGKFQKLPITIEDLQHDGIQSFEDFNISHRRGDLYLSLYVGLPDY